MFKSILVVAALFLAAAPAQAQGASPGPSEAAWQHVPSAADFARVYPPLARTQHVGGRVLLNCLILRTGRLRCSVAREEPRGMGFGAAALQLGREFRVAAHTRAGRATSGGRIAVPLTFTATPLRLN